MKHDTQMSYCVCYNIEKDLREEIIWITNLN